jgi:prepilin-type processing-associated H-X9-DG protein
MNANHLRGRPGRRAFQIKDLACLLAVIGLLASVQLATLAGSREGSQADQCRANLRRLAQAWSMYADDNAGRLPPNNGSSPDHPQGTWVAGWLDLSSSFDNINTDYLIAHEKAGKYGHLGPYLQRDVSVFRCPSDASTTLLVGRYFNRVRSVSMNSWMGGSAYCAGNGGNQYVNYRSVAEISQPARRWVITEELSAGINDSWFAIRLGDMVGGKWLVDYPGSFHSGGAWLNFADGHVEFRRWADPRTIPTIPLGQPVWFQVAMNPPNPDIAWLQERTSELR